MRKLVLAGILAGLSTGQLAHALSLELSPSTQTQYVGQSLAYDLWVKASHLKRDSHATDRV